MAATAWAVRQRTGAPSLKLMLLTLANYCDPWGCCWPSQEVLSEDTEQSIDSVQRHLKQLEKLKLIRRVIRPMGPGRWASRTYFLNISVAEMSKPQSAAQSDDVTNRNEVTPRNADTMPQGARDHAAPGPVTMPHQARDHAAPVRHEPSLEPESEPSLEPSSASVAKKLKPSAAARQRAFREGRKGIEVIQNRIAQKIGSSGWEVLQGLNAADLQMVTKLEERGQLGADAIELLRSRKPQKEPA